MSGPLVVSVMVGASVLALFLAARQLLVQRLDPIELRLEEYGVGRDSNFQPAIPETRRDRWVGLNRLLQNLGWGPRLSTLLARADLPVTAAEYSLLILGSATAGFVVALLATDLLLVAIGVSIAVAYIPIWYARFRERRRRNAFTEQLPEVLTLLVGGLRAGYGLSQAMGIVVERMPPPASQEFARVIRVVGFGFPLQTALRDMADRIDVDDLDMAVTAITVQYELGGNLAQTLETISETIRERLRIFREIRTMTAHQRFTARVLALEPVALAVIFYFVAPQHILKLFEPGMIRLLPISAVVMMFIGYRIMQRIVDIKV